MNQRVREGIKVGNPCSTVFNTQPNMQDDSKFNPKTAWEGSKTEISQINLGIGCVLWGKILAQALDYCTFSFESLAYIARLDQVQESTRPQKTIGERFMVKEESAASVGTDLGRPREEV
ncbi:hypothetical protein AVEN_13918-1 [Araneus ventricosus]|uniref:Uncharacterized protein n=1 Tax=Araneus ventricosus TaxID=182803 RepID=A0A4Y2HWW6_ARAVE|nr:hypothetical protein AVEN_13918-1 [Araneus ventricosus]